VALAGQVESGDRPWYQPRSFLDLIWGFINYIVIFVQTIFKSPQEIDEMRKRDGKRKFFGSTGGAGGGYPGGGGGGGGPRNRRGNDMRRNNGINRMSNLPVGGG